MIPIFSKIKKFFISIFASPITAAALAVAAPLAGFWVAVRNQSIRDSINERIPTLDKVDFEIFGLNADASVFVVIILVFVIGFALHKAAEASKARERHQLLDKEIQVVATLGLERAADDFLDAIRFSYPTVILNALAEKPDEGDLIKAIKLVLGKTATFVGRWMPLHHRPNMAVQCLSFIHRKVLKISRMRNVPTCSRIMFLKNMILILKNCVECLSCIQSFRPRPQETDGGGVRRIILPVPEADQIFSTAVAKDGGQRFKVLPGAAYSAALGKHAIIRNRNDLQDWCENADYEDQVRQAILRYFTTGNGKEVKSFLTLPLYRLSLSIGDKPALLGVLSIERSTEGLLPGQREKVFVPISSPLNFSFLNC